MSFLACSSALFACKRYRSALVMNNAFGPLERLDQPIQEDPIKATIMPANAVLVVFVERVHQQPRLIQHQQDTAADFLRSTIRGATGYQGQSPWLDYRLD
jgi:hypothetical protein